MSIVSRWKARLAVREDLEHTAKREHTIARVDVHEARVHDVHPRTQIIARRTAAARKLVLRRAQVARAKKVIARHTGAGGLATALRWAAAQVGTGEQPNGSNWGGKVETWLKASGIGFAAPWCQAFANAVGVAGGAPQVKSAYTPAVLGGQFRSQGFVPIEHPEEGCMVFFKFPGVSNATCDHVGICEDFTPSTVTCVEGSTSPTNGGSQNNGGTVAIKTRSRALVAGYVRVPYAKD